MTNYAGFLKTIASFAIAIPLGGLLGGLLTIAYRMPAPSDLPLLVVGMGATFALFGAFPALIFGIPALLILRKMRVSRTAATVVMTIGGAGLGAALTAGTFSGFEGLGAIAGGSIGLALGVLVYRKSVSLADAVGWVEHGVCVPYPSFLRFEGVIRRDERILRLMQDDAFAQQMSDLLASAVDDVVEESTGETLSGSSDDFRGLVAHYRQRGETYVDFLRGIVDYPMRKSVAREVAAELTRLGYRPLRTPQRPQLGR